MLKFIKEHKEGVFVGILSFILVCLISGLVVNAVYHETKEKKYFETLTPQQQQEYLANKEAEEKAQREANISRYEVVSAFRYIKVETNQFGGVTGTDVCYAFEYIDSSGKLHSIKGFENLEYGLTKVIIGDSDMYIVDKNGIDTYQYLQLTKETLENIENK